MKYTPDFNSRFRILKGGKISLVVSALITGSTMSFASPTGGQVTSGSASIAQNGSITTINQSTQKASINWNSFSIAPTETVNFIQPSSQSVTLNRVVGATPSLIQGAMNANGQVFLLNPNGVLFANGSQINVGGLVASTLNITDANFQSGNYVFEGNSQNSIINMGIITTAQGGYVAMMGKTVQNEGTIVATMGNVQLAGGDKISLNLNGNSLVNLTIDQGTLNALVENKGLIKADGGQVYLTTQALNTILDGMVNNTGIIEAQSIGDLKGEVILFAHGGTTTVSGTIDASGGFVETSGKELGIANGTTIKAKTWLLDPTNITIASGGAEPLAGTPATTSTAGDVTVAALSIVTALDLGTSVLLEADNNINVNEDIITGSMSGNATLTLSADNSIILQNGVDIDATQNGNAHTLGVVFDGNVVLSGSANAVKTNGGDITFNKTINGASALTLDAGSGIVTFTKNVGATTALDTLDVKGSTIKIYGNTITTANDQIYDGAVSLLTGLSGFTNPSFETDGQGSTTITGWTVTNSGVELNGGSTIAGYATPNDTAAPPIVPSGGTAPYDNYAYSGSYATVVSNNVDAGSGSNSLQMTSNGGNIADGYGVIHGPYVVSDSAVSLKAGEGVSFKWAATGGSDAYDVFGYMINTATGVTQVILDKTGRNSATPQTWTTASATALADGDYKFVFVSGSWDATGGRALGANLYLDDINVFDSKVFTGAKVDFKSTINAGSSNVTVNANKIDLGGNVSGTNRLALQARDTTKTIEIGGTANPAAGVLDITADEISKIQSGFEKVTIGASSQTGNVEFTGDTSLVNPYEFRTQGTMTIDSGVTVSSTTGLGNGLIFTAENNFVNNGTISASNAADRVVVYTGYKDSAVLGFTPTTEVMSHTRTNYDPSLYFTDNSTKWNVVYSNLTSETPETPATPEATNTVQEKEVSNIVTTIVNSTTVTPPAPIVLAPVVPQQQAQTQAKNNVLLQTIMPQGNVGEHFNLVGTTDGAASVQTVSMEQLQKASGGQGVNEIRVPLANDSLVSLINGGVNLPIGVSQEFYVVDNTKQATN
ncbi:MAG: filamentous hemagglutinin N-terminal domain-containing protein [Sulfuricurvum sp.]|uniref:two-partner secretion domain-containing protein n=1 Tax=Sulfuricurvum sp. TaxID=2025608 RepID=UPI0025ECBF1C|nr:filamentous hemagglutinin N-terminal domain-containing protein [Sulfuricurvum sp.]MBV5320355.1 filamentous hemagglutinin N-terminal domain-containing protein [Sulfuricurvum sp.]